MTGPSRATVAFITCATVGFLAIGSSQLSATPIHLDVSIGPSIQQIDNRPCIIGDPSCHNPDSFPYTLIAPQDEEGMLSSPTYTVDQIRDAIGGNTFVVGLDLNQAGGHNGGAYTLQSFALAIDGTTRYATSAPSTLVPVNLGNGFSDATIAMFDLTGLSGEQQLVFTATFSGGAAGREQFFLSPSANGLDPIPEPATIFLFGSGLAGAAAVRRRRAKSLSA
jgi:PEP-CTERM motif